MSMAQSSFEVANSINKFTNICISDVSEGLRKAASVIPQEAHQRTLIRVYSESNLTDAIRDDILRTSPFLRPKNLESHVEERFRGTSIPPGFSVILSSI